MSTLSSLLRGVAAKKAAPIKPTIGPIVSRGRVRGSQQDPQSQSNDDRSSQGSINNSQATVETPNPIVQNATAPTTPANSQNAIDSTPAALPTVASRNIRGTALNRSKTTKEPADIIAENNSNSLTKDEERTLQQQALSPMQQQMDSDNAAQTVPSLPSPQTTIEKDTKPTIKTTEPNLKSDSETRDIVDINKDAESTEQRNNNDNDNGSVASNMNETDNTLPKAGNNNIDSTSLEGSQKQGGWTEEDYIRAEQEAEEAAAALVAEEPKKKKKKGKREKVQKPKTLGDLIKDSYSGTPTKSWLEKQEEKKRRREEQERLAGEESHSNRSSPRLTYASPRLAPKASPRLSASEHIHGTPKSNHEEEAFVPDDIIPGGFSLAPKVQVVDGRIVLNQESLVVDRTALPPPTFEVVTDSTARHITSATYQKRNTADRWSSEDTDLFYKALRQYGTDFSLIEKLFPSRNRRHIKNKFKREEKLNAKKVEFALNNRIPIDVEQFKQAAKTSDEFKKAQAERLANSRRAALERELAAHEEEMRLTMEEADTEDWEVVATATEDSKQNIPLLGAGAGVIKTDTDAVGAYGAEDVSAVDQSYDDDYEEDDYAIGGNGTSDDFSGIERYKKMRYEESEEYYEEYE